MLKKVEPVIVKIAEAADEGLNPDGSMIYENFVSKGKLTVSCTGGFKLKCGRTCESFQHFGDEEALQIALRCWKISSNEISG